MVVLYFGWLVAHRNSSRTLDGVLDSGVRGFTDLVDIDTLDLKRDEYDEEPDDHEEEVQRNKRLNQGKKRILWKLYYSIV
jgi:AAT family amino acid transporter